MKWTERKKIAFIPVYRTAPPPPPAIAAGAVADVIPDDLEDQILKKVQFNFQPNLGDTSFRAWLKTTSSGKADIDAVVLPMKTVNSWEVAPTIFDAEMRETLVDQKFDHAAIVMLDGGGPTNSGFWSRVGIKGSTGSWVMEVMHGLTGIKDFYHFDNDVDPAENAIGVFDEMSAASLTHPSTFTKSEIGWAEQASIARQESPFAIYDLQFAGLPQPPISGRFSAVKIGSAIPYLMVEARKKNDQFDSGISSEGVIVYRVQTDNPYRQERPNGLLPLYLITKTALGVNDSVTADNGCVIKVLKALPGGFRIYIENPAQHLIDRTSGTPQAVGWPTSCVVPGNKEQIVVYRSASKHLNELWRDANGITGKGDLSEYAEGSPNAESNPFIFSNPDRVKIVLFRDNNGLIHSLYWTTGDVGHDKLSETATGSAKAAGDPVGYYEPLTNSTHVIYRSQDGHLHELSWLGNTPVVYGGNLTAAISAPKAAGDPSAFTNAGGVNMVTYRSVDRRILSLYWTQGGSNLDDLSGVAGTPAPITDPFAYYNALNNMHQVTYLANNGHFYELYWPGNDPVQGLDLTDHCAAPPTENAVFTAYYCQESKTKHVIYRTANNQLHELCWIQGGLQRIYRNLTTEYGLPPAADKPTAFASDNMWQHVVYRGTDNHIYEVVWRIVEIIW